MPTAPEAIRRSLAVVTATATTELLSVARGVPLERQADTLIRALPLIVPSYYDAAGSLAVAYYDEARSIAAPTVGYAPTIIGDPATDWIEREAKVFRKSLDTGDLDTEIRRLTDEITGLAEKEIARGYRDTIIGNTRIDTETIGWSRIARTGACRFCLMLSGKGAVYRSESTAIFAAHKNCNCAAQPEFRGGDHGPEANVIQYTASSRRARDDSVQAARNAKVRKYLNANYPDAPG